MAGTAEAVKRFAVYMRKKKNQLWFYDYLWKDERVKFEEIRETLSDPVCRAQMKPNNLS